MARDLAGGKSSLVLIAHGSRDARWTIPFERMAANLKNEYGPTRVYLAFMEHSRPLLLDVAAEIAKEGIGSFQLLPLFMSSGNHFAYDLPAQMQEARSRFPGLEISLLPPLSENAEFFEFIHRIAKAYAEELFK